MELNYQLGDIGSCARQFLLAAAAHRIIAFEGDMGAGKTTFIRALCSEWGVTDRVSSPTFPIINEYALVGGGLIYHIDLYRLAGVEEARLAGVEEAIASGHRCLVEWPGIAGPLFPENTLRVQIKTMGPDARKLVFNV